MLYFKVGDWVKLIHPEYDSKTIWKIVEIDFSPDGLSMVKLQNVLYYDETVKTTIDNIRPIPCWKDSPTPVEFKKLFPDYYKREFLFDDKTKGERDMYYLACDIKNRARGPLFKFLTDGSMQNTKNTVACYTNIKKVIFNDPATIIIWEDNTKTVVKCGVDEKYDPEKGMAMAVCKKIFGTNKSNSNYYNIFKKWLPEEKSLKDVLEPMTNNDLVPTFDSIRSIAEGLSQLNKKANIDITD